MVKLNAHDLNLIIEMLQLVVDYKAEALKPRSWQIFEQEYLPSIINQIRDNQFRCYRQDDNTFHWFVDQVCHSRRLHPGVPHSQGTPLSDIPLGEQVLEICRAASRGQKYYDQWRAGSRFKDLFEQLDK